MMKKIDKYKNDIFAAIEKYYKEITFDSYKEFEEAIPSDIGRLIKWIPIILDDRDFDFCFMYKIHQQKLESILNHIENENHYMEYKSKKYIVIAIKLLDIIMEVDDVEDYKKVNVRNIKRFNKYEDNSFNDILYYEIRQYKALVLYLEILKRYSFSWWD